MRAKQEAALAAAEQQKENATTWFKKPSTQKGK